VGRFAQTHNTTQHADSVQVNISPDGTQVLFASNWGQAGAVFDSYHAVMRVTAKPLAKAWNTSR